MADSPGTQPPATSNAAAAPAPVADPSGNPPTSPGNPPTPPGNAPAGSPAQAAEDQDGLETEDSATDGGSSIDDQISAYSASVTSSVVDYPTEYGRRYHAFRPGAYFMPNDEREMDRLDLSHAIILHMLEGRLYLAPLEKEKVHNILDIGTGTGIWAMEMGDLFPNAQIYGNDLSPIQPDWVPPNVKFEIDDVESPWLDDRKYDYIFCRLMYGAIKDWPKLMRNIYDNLNPGGWAEFIDVSGEYYSTDGTLTEEHAARKWNKTLLDTVATMGREISPGPKLEGWVRDAGFKNMHCQKDILPVGPWPKDPHYKQLGLMNVMQALQGLEAFTMRVFCGVLGRTATEVAVELAAVRKELKTLHAFHAQLDAYVVYGQKPLDETG